MGTVSTFHRKSSGSLGNFDGRVVWTQTAATWQGRPVLAYASPAGTSLHLPTSHGLVANLNPQGQPVMSYDPSIDAPWPLQVGQERSTVKKPCCARTLPMPEQVGQVVGSDPPSAPVP